MLNTAQSIGILTAESSGSCLILVPNVKAATEVSVVGPNGYALLSILHCSISSVRHIAVAYFNVIETSISSKLIDYHLI